MSDAASSARSWTWPVWVDEVIADWDISLKDALPDHLEAGELAKATSDITSVVKSRRAAEIELLWQKSEFDRIKKMKDTVSAGSDPGTVGQEIRLLDEQKVKFKRDFLSYRDHLANEDTEHFLEEDGVWKEMDRFEKLWKKERDLLQEVEQEMRDIQRRMDA